MIETDSNFEQLNSLMTFLLKKDIYKNRIIEACPNCNGKKYIRYGAYKGIQRYKCKECSKTFSNSTNSLWSYSKKNSPKWIQFIELVIERKSLRFCAEKLEISLVTAFYWRHKVLNGLNFDSIPEKLTNNVFISKKLIPENFKGSRNIMTDKRHNIWVIAAKSSNDSMIAKPISKIHWNLNSFNKKIYYLIDKKAYITTYCDRYLSAVAAKHNKKREYQVFDDKRIKTFPNILNLWLKKYHGVATKYLENYLSLFILFIINRKIDSISISNQLITGNRYIRTNEIGLTLE
ncbi:transposase-like protein [Clostridium saccharoperbutylacetonicum]|uniref:Transposase n=1 Tax=Clostridium saccharoperbutylacetonicum N1-4(HMT) TaxID=931276 RepID=M1M0V3_9CLOT|nr:hypothetical protein [Clostridium saccharoperbutylacetonicum]AGF59195.1 hypothetical protein Cspa_c54500 [Clostridium saccharoperbutylacetonicum N1-4(HMT)]NRT60018.1 transposase-like protein [Clostridium saccharoperbutylacetonicum]NSB23330.1 transposase-like protein [Clostridium saccharoperbutylacetonicum]NSB42700.1 transposase-like protein [Clostridium saccharoperbutylacetonicum]